MRLGVIELARVIGFAGMLIGMAAGAGLTGFAIERGSLAFALLGVLLAAASSCFDLFGESALVRWMTWRFDRRSGSLLRAASGAHALVNVEPERTVARIKRVPDEIAILELVPNSGRLALEGVLGRAEIRPEHRPTITARKDQLWPVVTLRFDDAGQHFDLVIYQQPSFVRTFAVILGHLRVMQHPSDRLVERMRSALEGVALPGRNVPSADVIEATGRSGSARGPRSR